MGLVIVTFIINFNSYEYSRLLLLQPHTQLQHLYSIITAIQSFYKFTKLNETRNYDKRIGYAERKIKRKY